MLSFWNCKPEERPDFTSIVYTLSNYLEITSDYLDLSVMVKDSSQDKVPNYVEAQAVEEDPECSLTHVPAKANNYYLAGI